MHGDDTLGIGAQWKPGVPGRSAGVGVNNASSETLQLCKPAPCRGETRWVQGSLGVKRGSAIQSPGRSFVFGCHRERGTSVG